MGGAPGDGFAIWRPALSDKTSFFAQLGLGFSLNPLRVDNYVDDLRNAAKIKGNPLTTQLTTTMAVGVELLGRLSLQIAFPLTLYQAGSPTDSPLIPAQFRSVSISSPAPGDLRIEARGVVARNASKSFTLGLSAAAILPTGNPYAFTSDRGFGASFGFGAEYDARIVTVALNAAYRLRPTTVLNELLVSSEVVYGVGAYVPLRRGSIRLGAELFGGFGASPTTEIVYAVPKPQNRTNVGDLDTTPLEWMLNGKMYFGVKRRTYAGLGAGTRLTGGYAPDFRSVALVGAAYE
jgi:hypothetical protein